jgi:aryl-alcohol dehydrogenase-like predicted oxidoreductase
MRLAGTDLDVSRICCGTSGFHGLCIQDDMDRIFAIFRDAGGNFFDTAHVYRGWDTRGSIEIAIGEYFRRNGGWDKCVVATKGGHPGAMTYRTVEYYLSPHRIEADIDDSLGRMGVDTLDLYYLHRDDERMGVAEIIDYLNEEIKRGRIRYPAASNWCAKRMEEANNYASQKGLQGFVASQPEWSLAVHTQPPGNRQRFLGPEDHEWHRASQLPVIPYSSAARGYFEGRENAPLDNPVSQARRARARQLASELGATAGQMALAWLRAQPFPVIPLIGSTHPEHFKAALAAADISLSAQQRDWLTGNETL